MKHHDKLLAKRFFAYADETLSLCRCRLDPARYAEELIARAAFSDPMDQGELFPRLLMLYAHEESPCRFDKEVLSDAEKCLSCFSAMLRENGTLDDPYYGMSSTSRTAEAITIVFPSLTLLERTAPQSEAEAALLSLGKQTLRRMADALVDGGFREGYHRWLIVAALAIAHHFLGDERYPAYADTLLAQEVKMSTDGEYPERNHSIALLCNRAFFLTAAFRGDERFLTYPRENLRMMQSLLEPYGTVNNVTAYGWNQMPSFSAAAYYPALLTMAITDRDETMAYLADELCDTAQKEMTKTDLCDLLLFFMTDGKRHAAQNELQAQAPEKKRAVFFDEGKLARVENPEKQMSMTLLCAEHPVFFELKYKNTAIEARFAGCFFGMRSQFRATEIIPTEDGYKLIYDAKAGYRSQLKEKPETSDWRLMDHSKREFINIQQFRVEITVHLLEDGARFDIETAGCERIPTKFEFLMAPDKIFENESIVSRTKAGDYFYLKDGSARYFLSGHSYAEIETDHFYQHTYGEAMRGAVPKDPQKFTVCMTADTPQSSTVTLRIKELD